MTNMANGIQKMVTLLGSMVGLSALAATAQATTITVTTTGAPVSGKCSLTQAIQAAVTNTAVGGKGGCAAGQSGSTDTIVLAANTTYQNYGAPLHVPASSGGTLIIRGTLSSGSKNTFIRGRNYGFPSPNPIDPGACQYPHALFSAGSNVTVRDLTLVAEPVGTGHGGICQYGGTLTVNNVIVGDGAEIDYFNRGGIRAISNTAGAALTFNLTNSVVGGNSNIAGGGGLTLYDNVNATITGTMFYSNWSQESGGGVSWQGGGNLSMTNCTFYYNRSESHGGGMFLSTWSSTKTVTLSGLDMQQNESELGGGAIDVGNLFGTDKLVISNSFIRDNWSTLNFGPQNSFNTDPEWAYNAIRCTNGSDINWLMDNPWGAHSPRLKGDGTCTLRANQL